MINIISILIILMAIPINIVKAADGDNVKINGGNKWAADKTA